MPPKKSQAGAKASNNGVSSGSEHPEAKGLSKKDATDCTQHWEEEEHMKENQKAYKKFQEDHRRSKQQQEENKENHTKTENDDGGAGQKRGRGANIPLSSPPASKKQKSNDTNDQADDSKDKSKQKGEARAPAGDKTRVPKQGQKVQWHALPGYVNGEVVEIVYGEKTVQGKHIKASKDDPRIVLKSEKSGKICVHKPEAVYFD